MLLSRRTALLGVAGVAGSMVPLQVLAAAQLRPVGVFTGVLNLGSTRLPLRFDFGADNAVTLYSVNQGNDPIAGQANYKDAGKISAVFASINAKYSGRLVSPDRIEGTFRQATDVELTLMRGEQGLNDPVSPLTDQALAIMLQHCGAPALGAAASCRGVTPRLWVAGRRAIGATPRVTASDSWHVGSISKSFTATLVARLVEAGMVHWDLRVVDVLCGIAPDMNPAYRNATFRHLLSHRSGLPADLNAVQLMSFTLADNFEVRAQRRRYTRLALGLDPVGPIESSYTYSNNGYVVAAAMLEAVLGLSWEELMRKHVFLPLELGSAGFGPPDAGAVGPLRQPVGHSADVDAKLLKLFGGRGLRAMRPGNGEVVDNPRVLGPAGRVHLCLADLLSYLDAHRDGSEFLRPQNWQILHTPPFGGDYAMGWVVRPDGTLWHNGSNKMWYAEAQFNAASGISAGAVCNESRDAAAMAVGTALLRAAAAARG